MYMVFPETRKDAVDVLEPLRSVSSAVQYAAPLLILDILRPGFATSSRMAPVSIWVVDAAA